MKKKILNVMLTLITSLYLLMTISKPVDAAIRNVIVDLENGDLLRIKCKEVYNYDSENLFDKLDDLWDTLERYYPYTIGISGPMIGINERICVFKLNDKRLEMINPIVVEQTGHQDSMEGCLSMPDVFKNIDRPQKIIVKYYDRVGNENMLTAYDYEARIIMHQIDHINGVVITDYQASSLTGSTISNGSTAIVVGCTSLIVGIAIGVLIGKKGFSSKKV